MPLKVYKYVSYSSNYFTDFTLSNTLFVLTNHIISIQEIPMASVEVQSAANTLPEKVEITPEAPKEVKPVVAAPEPAVTEESPEETSVDVPTPVEEPQPPTAKVPVETETKVVEEEPKSEVEQEPTTETIDQEEVTAAEETKEETPAATEAVAEDTPAATEELPEETPVVTEELKESVKEDEKPAEVVAAEE
ncbi:unnamed protein product [Lactuca saligna]|uniref:Uncharacterized protein n=1 Tax=Lactuca saligna TaxID=75948 RepID=A0AA35VX79_LACSI|nr:unnamed protein product [Lactuca saligna]